MELLRDRVRANEPGPADPGRPGAAGLEEDDLARQQAQLTQLRKEDALQTRMEAVRKDLEDTRAQLRQADSTWQAALRRDREELAECRRREREAEEAWMALRMQEHLGLPGQAPGGRWSSTMRAMEKGSKPPWRRSAGEPPGVFGPVGELFRVSPRDTVALETALGGAMQNLLVEDEQAGKAVLRLVKQREGGRVTCLPLTALRPAVLREEGLEREPGYLAVAAELVSCEEVLRPAVNALLGRTVVVDHLDHGVQLAKARHYRFPVVTLEGEILRPSGAMTGGSVNRRGGLLSRGAEEEVLRVQWAQARQAAAQGGEVLERARRETQRAAEVLEARQSAGPTPPETLLRSQNDQEETLRTLGEELASLRGTMGAFSPLLAQLRHQLRTAEADQARQDGLLRDTVQQTQALEKEIAQREAKVETLEAARRALSVQLEQSTGQKLALERARVENDRAARAQNDLQLRLQRETGVLEQRKLQAGMEEKRLLDRLWDTYGMTHQGALAVRVPVEDAAQAQRRTVQLNQAIQALGTVNLGAVEEFQRVEERYGYLKDQKNDVETAQRELEGVIQEITQEMEAIFRRELARIQAAFSQTFADLFGGGQGTLSLEDETDVLRCGIEIRAQPPGKTLRAISLLSGGERSLVAIALYFAILKIHPTPFCVVDEIEAALDEANGARFIRYLRAVASETQFLLITHRRETMEAADVLYGVTMERQGVSRVLKLDLHQAEALLDGAPA